jgi:hypothetical protein
MIGSLRKELRIEAIFVVFALCIPGRGGGHLPRFALEAAAGEFANPRCVRPAIWDGGFNELRIFALG